MLPIIKYYDLAHIAFCWSLAPWLAKVHSTHAEFILKVLDVVALHMITPMQCGIFVLATNSLVLFNRKGELVPLWVPQ